MALDLSGLLDVNQEDIEALTIYIAGLKLLLEEGRGTDAVRIYRAHLAQTLVTNARESAISQKAAFNEVVDNLMGSIKTFDEASVGLTGIVGNALESDSERVKRLLEGFKWPQ